MAVTTPASGGSKETPNCLECPNRIPVEESSTALGRSVSGDVCAVKGKVLNAKRMDPMAKNKLGITIAAGCDSFGVAKPLVHHTTFPVAMPDLKRRGLPLYDKDGTLMKSVTTPGASRPSTCKSCVNFVPETRVAGEWGWNAGFCGARGDLILSNKFANVASNCDMGEFGTSTMPPLSDVQLFKEYDTAFNPSVDPVSHFLKTGDLIDPLEYDFDREASDEDKEYGILGWRFIQSPHGDNFVALPVFDPKSFDDDELAHIPKSGDDEHPELYIDHAGLTYTVAACWVGLGETPALWGRPGLGKTELLRHMAWLMQIPFTRLSITGSSEIDDIAGKSGYSKERGTFFQYGRLPRDYTRRRVICVDEPNTGPPDVWQFLRPLIDNGKQLALDMNQGEILPKHKYCFMGMAMNPAWDVRNVGAMEISAADGSRLIHISVELPPANVERQIIQSRVKIDGWELKKSDLDLIMKIAGDIRNLCDDNVLPLTWGIREQIKVARAWRWFPPRTVYAICAGDYMDNTGRDHLTGVLNSYLRS